MFIQANKLKQGDCLFHKGKYRTIQAIQDNAYNQLVLLFKKCKQAKVIDKEALIDIPYVPLSGNV